MSAQQLVDDAPRLLSLPGPPTWQVPSRSRPDIVYHVTRRRHGALTCTCTAAAFGRDCHHRRLVESHLGALTPVMKDETMTVTDITRDLTTPSPIRSAELDANALERLLAANDLAAMNATQRVQYYVAVCQALGLNHLTLPLRFIEFDQGGLALYFQKNATEQLRRNARVSITGVETAQVGDIFEVTVHARTPDGREDLDIGAVNVRGLGGQHLANAMKRAVTQGKRRVTLSIVGLGWLDESEVDDVAGARYVDVDMSTGEIEARRPVQPTLPPGKPATVGEISGKAEKRSEPEQRRAVPKAPPPATNMTEWWRAVREAGWDADIIQAASQATYAKAVQHLDPAQLAELRDAATSGRVQATAEGEWRVVPVGGDEASEEGPTETI